jgi:hypothetical protein
MPQNNPPSGYHEVPAPGQAGPPPGYHEVSGPQGEGFGKSFGATLPGYHEDDPFGAFKDLWSGAKEMLAHPLVSTSLIGHGIVDPMQETYEAGTKRFAQPGAGNKIAGAAEWLESGIPMLGPMLAKAGHQFESGDVGGGLGTTAGAALPMLAPSAMEGAARIPGKVGALAGRAVPAIQKTLGVGPEFTEQAVKDWQGKAVGVTEANESALAKARANEETFQGKVEAAKQANETARQTAVQKQQLQTEAMGHAKELGEHLSQLKEGEKAFGKSLYPEVEGTVDAKEMQGRLQNAIDSNIRGTDKPPAALTRIVKELGPEDVTRSTGPTVGGRHMDLSNPADFAAFQRMKSAGVFNEGELARMQGEAGPSDLSFEQMHGYYSELGEELGKDLSGDERASVTAARAELLGEMRKMAESEGKLSQFTEAQKNWSKYENTFNKTWSDKRGVASPIAKALNAKDPVTGEILPDRLGQLLGKDQNYKLAQQMLSRYDAAKPELLQLMKEKMDQVGGMPKTIKETPVPERSATPVNLKPPPPTIDIEGLKGEAIKKKMDMLGGFSGRGMFIDAASLVHFLTTGNPIALSIPIGRRLLAKAIRSNGSLIGVTPEEAAMLKNIDQSATPKNFKPSQVNPTKAQAAKTIFRGNKPATPAGWTP